LFFLEQKFVDGQEFYKIPDQIINFYEMTEVDYEYMDTIPAFEISHFITLKEYKEFLVDVKKDSSEYYYLHMLPDSSIAKSPEIYNEYITEKKYEKYPVLGVTWEGALNYCWWKSRKDNDQGVLEFSYSLPLAREWMAAYSYLTENSIKNDFNNKYADLLFSSYLEPAFPYIYKNKFRCEMDYIHFANQDSHLASKRKMIIGSSYVYEMCKFFTNYNNLHSYEGSAYVSFRIVKNIGSCRYDYCNKIFPQNATEK
jgi:hypothetical protein